MQRTRLAIEPQMQRSASGWSSMAGLKLVHALDLNRPTLLHQILFFSFFDLRRLLVRSFLANALAPDIFSVLSDLDFNQIIIPGASSWALSTL